MTTAGPMLNGLIEPKMAKPATQSTVTTAIQTSLGQRRAASPNRSSTGARSLPSTGSSSQPAR